MHLKKFVRIQLFKWRHRDQPAYSCPVCRYRGPFASLSPATGVRRDAMCPQCGALERHRLQWLVLDRILAGCDCSRMRMLHFAPESYFTPRFSALFDRYETADLAMPGVDHQVDLQSLPFESASYDFVYASHVLEHIPDDEAAISEIRRILRPGGIAILPVPLIGPVTIEYPEPNPAETMHVRAPGPDYFDRYRPHFSRVDLYRSEDFPARHQLFVHEDRTTLPSPQSPHRLPMEGDRHSDTVPVCFA